MKISLLFLFLLISFSTVSAAQFSAEGDAPEIKTITLVPNDALNVIDLRTTDADHIIGTMTLTNTDRNGFTLTFSTDSEGTYGDAVLILQNESNTAGSIAADADRAAFDANEGYFIPWLLEVQLDENPTGGAAGFPNNDPLQGTGSSIMDIGGGDPEGAITINEPTITTLDAVYNLKAHTTADSSLFDGTYNATLNIVMSDNS